MKNAPGNRNSRRIKKKTGKKNLIFKLCKTIFHYFPDLYDKIREIEDCRKKKVYELTELIMAAIMMFVFKKGSRNAFNNERESDEFVTNYERIFGVRFPSMDTVDEVMRKMNEKCLEKLKTKLVRILIKKKVFHKNRILCKYFLIVIDGSHVMTVNEGHCEHCLKRTSEKSGKTTYFHNVVEAKLVTENGFSISLATEWVENPGGTYDKQDCELKAFVRIAEKLKRDFPRLPICIGGDGLYPNQTFFRICRENGWEFIVSFRDGNLPSVWEEVRILKELSEENSRMTEVRTAGKKSVSTYKWVSDIDYQGFMLDWSECLEESDDRTTRFVFVSSLRADWFGITEITEAGRNRWKIENEGFDIQKNHGYELGHKYSRVSVTATKNYYQCMQIAHLINQLFELSQLFMPLMTGKMTVKHLWECMLGEIRVMLLNIKILKQLLKRSIQFRYD